MKVMFKYLLIILMCTPLCVFGQGEDLDDVLVQANQMPIWNTCEDGEDAVACTETQLKQYIKKYLNYPQSAREEKIEGSVTVSCIINSNGKVVQPHAISSIGGGCEAEALRLVQNMPLWRPAEHKGKKVSVVYAITVPFKLGILPRPNEQPKPKIVHEEPFRPITAATPPSVANGVVMDVTNGEKSLLPSSFQDTPEGRVYTRVAQMPYFMGCENLDDQSQGKRECSNKNLRKYLSRSLVYPQEAKDKGIEGIVFVSFVVDEKGYISNPKVIRNIGGGCGEEALKVVSTMPQWEPGREKGQTVKTQMTLPIRFYFSSESSGKYQIHWGALRGKELTESKVEKMLKEDIIVRDVYGNDKTTTGLSFFYEKGSREREVSSNGKMTAEMMRMLRKMKAGGELLIISTVQDKGELKEVYRLLKIVKG